MFTSGSNHMLKGDLYKKKQKKGENKNTTMRNNCAIIFEIFPIW